MESFLNRLYAHWGENRVHYVMPLGTKVCPISCILENSKNGGFSHFRHFSKKVKKGHFAKTRKSWFFGVITDMTMM